MLNISMIGNLTRDPEGGVNKNGKSACNFTVAVNKRRCVNGEWKDDTQYIRVTAWNQLAENCKKYLAKGKKVYVSGDLQQVSVYTTKAGQAAAQVEVWADKVEFLSPAGEQRGQASTAEAPAAQFTAVENPDDLPF